MDRSHTKKRKKKVATKVSGGKVLIECNNAIRGNSQPHIMCFLLFQFQKNTLFLSSLYVHKLNVTPLKATENLVLCILVAP